MKRALLIVQICLVIIFAVIIYFLLLPLPITLVLLVVILLSLIFLEYVLSRRKEKQLETKISDLSKELNVASTRLTSVSQEIGITIEENNESSNALFGKTQAMSSLTADVNNNLNNTITHIKQMIGHAEETRDAAISMEHIVHDSFDNLKAGMTEILHIVDTMQDIKTTSSTAGESIEKLRTASDGVITIIEKISDISQQMHLIAINASVEAARAGSKGNSFATVANEFRSLTASTDTAIGDISSLIYTIQNDIADVYRVSKENSERVDDGVRNSSVIEGSLKRIEQSFKEVIKTVDRISTISEAEAGLADDMTEQIDQIESQISQTSEHVTEVYNSALSQKNGIENIAEMSRRLRSASEDLLEIAGSGSDTPDQTLSAQAQKTCSEFFDVIEKELCFNSSIVQKNTHHELLELFKSAHAIVEAVWTNELNGRFICSIPEAGIANASMRDWFRSALTGERFISSIYISGITKNRCITLSLPYHDQSGSIAGIIGVDLNLDLIEH